MKLFIHILTNLNEMKLNSLGQEDKGETIPIKCNTFL